MKHHALEQLQIVAEVDQDYPRQTLSKSQRLERWAALLGQNPERRLSTLHQTEYQPASQRAAMRGEGHRSRWRSTILSCALPGWKTIVMGKPTVLPTD